MDTYSSHSTMGIGIPYSLCNILQLFPYSFWSEDHTPYPCEHVQLYTADHCDCAGHYSGDGYSDLAKGAGGRHGLRRRGHRQPQQI